MLVVEREGRKRVHETERCLVAMETCLIDGRLVDFGSIESREVRL